ncbi:accessory Sec system protein Asp1 [Streptococcus sp. A27]|uniref:accessory Sec system protein Asp1 n=1 Tax=unclassified Streptococcus TaxID=2608887 RepID=UPI00374D8915
MFYFVPSWYQGNRKWYMEAPLWFRAIENMTFDDAVNQLKTFQAAGEETMMLLLGYQPHLRYFLHRQDILSTPYWSFFDEIQNIQSKNTKVLQVTDLTWPQGARFVYTPFALLVKIGDERIAEVHFAESGNLLKVEYFKENEVTYHYLFDDRGFLSSILYFSDGKPSHQDYLNEKGVWQVREHLTKASNLITINPRADQEFFQLAYESWDDLILEKLFFFKRLRMTEQDYLVIAVHEQHNRLLLDAFEQQKKVLSFSGDRYSLQVGSDLKRLAQEGDVLVVDSEKNKLALEYSLAQLGTPAHHVSKVTPFDTRLRLGRSQTVKELIIYWQIDGASREDYLQTLHVLLQLMEENPLIELDIVSYERARNMKALESEMIALLQEKYTLARFMKVSEEAGENQLEEDQEMTLSSIRFHTFTNENQIIRQLDTTRLVLDLGQVPHLYTQIASISAGIPQVNHQASEYVTHGENGWIVTGIKDLTEAVAYYFDGLTNWNRSLVSTVQKMGDYTSGRIIDQWKELLENKG